MKYSEYEVGDFLRDEFFVKWIKENDPHVDDFWKKWLVANPEKVEIIAEAKSIILSLQYDKIHELPDEDYLRIYEDVLKESHSHFYRVHDSKSISLFIKIAAAILLVAISTFLLQYKANDNDKQLPSTHNSSTLSKSTLAGQKLSFKLPDGSSVKLNALSKLTFSQSIGSSKREVFLEGEAFFEVVKDPERPFIVNTTELSTTALGTSFNVKAYKVDNDHEISLLTGSVMVEKIQGAAADEPNILLPGDQITYSKEHDLMHRSKFNEDKDIAWRDGTIVFEETSFKNVIKTLERWYGVQFEVINESNKTKENFSGVFANENLERVLEILSFSGGFTFEIQKDLVTIEFLDNQ
ncbi:MAG: FecR domain-containing protein [Bacteroidota bacterium]